jgi:hypothetical protein
MRMNSRRIEMSPTSRCSLFRPIWVLNTSWLSLTRSDALASESSVRERMISPKESTGDPGSVSEKFVS